MRLAFLSVTGQFKNDFINKVFLRYSGSFENGQSDFVIGASFISDKFSVKANSAITANSPDPIHFYTFIDKAKKY